MHLLNQIINWSTKHNTVPLVLLTLVACFVTLVACGLAIVAETVARY